MKKLLHEQLKECSTFEELLDLCTEVDDGRDTSWVETFHNIADKIECYYIPLSCDSDGKPWKIGDDCITSEGKEATIVGYRGRDKIFIDLYDECYCARCDISDIRRPRSKTVDVDGVEIKERDVVWDIKHSIPEKHIVIEVIPEDDCVICDDGFTYTANFLTHNEPDSLKKLRDDISQIIAYGGIFDNKCTLKELQQFEDRLSALIEKST